MHSELRERLKTTRKAQRYSQRQLAEATRLSRTTISLLERNEKHDPRLSVIREVSRVLGDPLLFCCPCAACVEVAS